MDLVGSLRLADLRLVAAAVRSTSLDAAAREEGVTVVRVLGALDAVETALGAAIVERDSSSASHLVLTPRGALLGGHVAVIAEHARTLRVVASASSRLVLAAPSFVLDLVMPALAASGRIPTQAIAASTHDIPALTRAGEVDVLVTVGDVAELDAPWASTRVGELRFALFGAAAVARALGPRPSPEDVVALPFVGCALGPSPALAEKGDDSCPLPRLRRSIAHEAQTMALACRVAAETDALAYGPATAAAAFVAAGALVEIDVPAWDGARAVTLHVDTMRVSETTHDWVAGIVRSALRTTPGTSAIVPSAGTRAASGAEDERTGSV
jgi:DNA-binding transcriptional LysR family regulator